MIWKTNSIIITNWRIRNKPQFFSKEFSQVFKGHDVPRDFQNCFWTLVSILQNAFLRNFGLILLKSGEELFIIKMHLNILHYFLILIRLVFKLHYFINFNKKCNFFTNCTNVNIGYFNFLQNKNKGWKSFTTTIK